MTRRRSSNPEDYYGYPYFRPGWVLPFWRGGGQFGRQMFVPDLQLPNRAVNKLLLAFINAVCAVEVARAWIAGRGAR